MHGSRLTEPPSDADTDMTLPTPAVLAIGAGLLGLLVALALYMYVKR
ncbi:MAG: major capsid protein, partial [Gemmatimonadales bacterium]